MRRAADREWRQTDEPVMTRQFRHRSCLLRGPYLLARRFSCAGLLYMPILAGMAVVVPVAAQKRGAQASGTA
jgi:hypothetical protein